MQNHVKGHSPKYFVHILKICVFKGISSLTQHISPKVFCKKETPLKVQSCNLYNNKYMIASTQIINTEILAFVAALVFKLLSLMYVCVYFCCHR